MPFLRWGILSTLLVTSSAFSQQLSFGVLGGVPLTSAVIVNPSGFTFDSARKGMVGGLVEVSLPFGLSVEGDVLFHPLNLEVGANPPPPFTAITVYDYKVFEFPVLAKARLTSGLLRPFVEGGPTFRGSPDTLNISHFGVTVGFGVELGKRRLLRVSPEVRYTRWGSDNLITANGVSGEQLNQVALLLGVSF
jgi:hypothetical protein